MLGRVIRSFEARKIPYMVVGGLAVTYYGFPRATFDIDLVVAVNVKTQPEDARALVKILQKLQFQIHLRHRKN